MLTNLTVCHILCNYYIIERADHIKVPASPGRKGERMQVDHKFLFRLSMTDFNLEQESLLNKKLQETFRGFSNPYIHTSLEAAIAAIIRYAHEEMFRYVFRHYMLKEMGLDDLDAKGFKEMYENEVKTNGVHNFQNLCEEKKIAVTVSAVQCDSGLELNVHYPGSLSREDARNIGVLVDEINRHHVTQPGQGGEPSPATTLTLELAAALIKLRGIGISFENFKIIHKGHRNRVVFTVVDELLHRRSPRNYIRNLNKPEWFQNVISTTFDVLGYSILVFDLNGILLESKGPAVEKFHLDDPGRSIEDMVNPAFYENIFYSPFSIKMTGRINNYRVSLKDGDSGLEILYNMNGYLDEENRVITIWQEVNVQSAGRQLSEGSLFENTYMYSLITPYIPSSVLVKARETARQGEKKLPDEQKKLTIMFADLVNFTQNIEKLQFEKVMELLNLSMGTIVKTIERHNGYVDKFLGDGILCVFSTASEAVVSAFEIQNNFAQLNEFRLLRDEPPIEIRLGINTGNVILGSVGTSTRMDRTVLGDVVNTAARAEQYSRKNAVLVTQSTMDELGDSVIAGEQITAKFKGKAAEQTLFYLKSIKFIFDEKERMLELPTAGAV